MICDLIKRWKLYFKRAICTNEVCPISRNKSCRSNTNLFCQEILVSHNLLRICTKWYHRIRFNRTKEDFSQNSWVGVSYLNGPEKSSFSSGLCQVFRLYFLCFCRLLLLLCLTFVNIPESWKVKLEQIIFWWKKCIRFMKYVKDSLATVLVILTLYFYMYCIDIAILRGSSINKVTHIFKHLKLICF